MTRVAENGLPVAGWYRDPHAAGNERWWNGTAWSADVRVLQPTHRLQPSAVRPTQFSNACPKCGSAEAKTLAMIRAQGTTTGTGTSVGWVQGGVNQPGHMATFTTRSTTYTAAAEAAAPPRKRFNGAALLASGVVLGIVLGFIGYTLGTNGSFGTAQLNVGIAAVVGVLMFGAGLVLFPLDFAYNRDVYPASRERWARTWQCLRCGARFLV